MSFLRKQESESPYKRIPNFVGMTEYSKYIFHKATYLFFFNYSSDLADLLLFIHFIKCINIIVSKA